LKSRIEYQPGINNLIDSLNDKMAQFYNSVPSNIENSDMSYFLCEYRDDDMSRKNKILLREIGKGMARLVRLRNLAVNKMGYNTYYSMNTFMEYSVAAAPDEILDQLEEQSQSEYQLILSLSNDMSNSDIEGLCELLRQRAEMRNEYSYYFNFSEKNRFKTLINIFKKVGFDLNKLPIYFNEPDSNILSDIARAFVINCSNDIRVVMNSSGGMESFYSLFRAAGFAIYASHIKQESFLFLDEPKSLRAEIILSIFEKLLDDENWQKENLNLPGDFASRWQQDYKELGVVDLRTRLLMARFEEQLYLNNAWQVIDIYRELFDRIMQRPADNAVGWWGVLNEYINRPFYIRRKLIADMAAAQISSCLADDESGFESSLFKYGLIQNCFAPGSQIDWYDMLLQLTGEKLNAAYFLKRPESTMESDY